MDSSNPFDPPTAYQIRLKGKLSPIWADWFAGFTIAHTGDDTLLTGSVVDQAALHGLLAKIRDLGLPIVSILSD